MDLIKRIFCSLVLLPFGQSILIENESFTRRLSRQYYSDYFTSEAPLIPMPTASVAVPSQPAATQMYRRLLLHAAVQSAAVNLTRPILLAPQIDRRIDDRSTTVEDSAEPKHFYTQSQSTDQRKATSYSSTNYDRPAPSQPYIDYRKVYGIRYVPNKIRRSFVSVEQNAVNSLENSETAGSATMVDSLPAILDDAVDNSVDGADSFNANQMAVDEEPAMATDEPMTTADPITTEPSVAVTEMVEMVDPAVTEQPTTIPEMMVPTTNATTTNPSSTVASVPITPGTSSSNIMAPSRVHTTLQLLKNRFTNLLANGLYTAPSNGNGQRFLSLFNVIKFPNIPCATNKSPLQSLNGTCYNQQECDDLGGVAVDECANGFGVCCVFQYGCGGVSRQNISYFKSPNYPAAHQSRLVCSLTLELWPNVKQVLVELLFFELKPPLGGTCSDDQFVITGQNVNSQVPVLCGINSGQHMYVNVESSVDRKLFLSVLTNSATARAFNIRVSQLQEAVAPAGCLQYYTDTAGFVQTFNYDDYAEIVPIRFPSYFNNLNYAICIRRAPDFCTIAYGNEIGRVEYRFQLLNVDADGVSVIPADQAGAEIYNCADDFIAVNGIRLCGEKFNDASVTEDFTVNAPVLDSGGGPIVLPVRTNAESVGRGFKLYFEQQPCL